MASQKLIVNELLAFIQNSLHTSDLDHYSIVETCRIKFKAEDIDKAKTLLLELLDKDNQILTKGCSQDLFDIIDLFEKTDDANVPVFVAEQSNKLPIIQKLMMEICFLKHTMFETNSKLEAAEKNVDKLCERVYAMHRAELKQCCSQSVSNKGTSKVKSESNDPKLHKTRHPAPAPLFCAKKRHALCPFLGRIQMLPPNDNLDLSELDVKVDKNGYLKFKTRRETDLSATEP